VGKEQYIISTTGSKLMALLFRVVLRLEDLAEEHDFDVSSVTLPYSLVDQLTDSYSAESPPRRIVLYSSSLFEPVRSSVEAPQDGNVEVSVEPGFGDTSYKSLYLASVRIVKFDSLLLREKAKRTSVDGIEYMFIYLGTGDLAVFEGEHYKVKLPFVQAAANIHTHPEGSCGLSLPDVASGLELLVTGGLLAASATPSCLAYMVRVGMVSEDDYIRLKEMLYRKRVVAGETETVVFGRTFI
jgi:proteasome lid subunit RPN8/RPN11